MSNEVKTVKEPFLHIVKRENIKLSKTIVIYAIAILSSLLTGAIICSLVSTRGNIFSFFSSLLEGCFGTERKLWLFLQDFALLLAVSMALIVSFKMKFWNLGANGQILMGGLAAIACSFYLGGKIPNGLLIVIEILASILAGALWAAIPAVCKVFWNTNETLFTLMLNYIAAGLVNFFIALWVTGGSGVLRPLSFGKLPELVNPYLLIILFGVIVTALITIYLKYTKHGYELSVVGDSQNTAKYIGINVKKVVIRTLVLSGVICGLVGLLLTSGMSNSISDATAANRGFVAIMTSWLANCNPLMAIATCGLVVFVTKGMGQVRPAFGMLDDTISNLVMGIVYFFIIACAFFIQYRVVFNSKTQAFFDKVFNPIKKFFAKKEATETEQVVKEEAKEQEEKLEEETAKEEK